MAEPQSTINGFTVTTNLGRLAAAPFDPPFWVISDTHFFHDNIVRYAGRPVNHNHLMEDAWKQMVGEKDKIVHLGDVAFGNKESLALLGPTLPGDKYLVLGNHDRRGKKFYNDIGFTIIEPFVMMYRGYDVAFSHEPLFDYTRGTKSLNVHGHIHQREMDDPKYINASVELTDYKPVQIENLLDRRIDSLV